MLQHAAGACNAGSGAGQGAGGAGAPRDSKSRGLMEAAAEQSQPQAARCWDGGRKAEILVGAGPQSWPAAGRRRNAACRAARPCQAPPSLVGSQNLTLVAKSHIWRVLARTQPPPTLPQTSCCTAFPAHSSGHSCFPAMHIQISQLQ